jgi:hypothetical protein
VPAAAPVLLAVALLAAPGSARAEACPAHAGAAPSLSEVPAERRIAWLRGRIDAERGPARAWSWTWGVVDGALTAGQLAAIPAVRGDSSRGLLAASAASSALGVAQVLLAPITPPREAPGDGGCGTLAALEASLDRSARNEALGSGALAHGANVLVNAALGVATGLTERRWELAALAFAGGVALGEAQLLTQPTRLVHDRARYRAGELESLHTAAPRPIRWAIAGAPAQRGGVLFTLTATF